MEEINEVMKKISEYNIKELRSICQATAPDPSQESLVGLFSRKFSIYFTWLFLRTSISPNQITVLSTLVFFVGICMFFFNDYYLGIAASLVVFFSIVLDGCDGEVARFRKKGGILGSSYVEPVSHDIQYGFSFVILGLVLSFSLDPFYLLLGAIAAVTKLQTRLLDNRFSRVVEKFNGDLFDEGSRGNEHKKKNSIRIFINKNLFSSTAIFLVLFIAAILNHLEIFLWYFAIGYTVVWIMKFARQLSYIKRNKII
jgi:hypothetical protein